MGISAAINTALKVALYDFFDGPLAHSNCQLIEKVNHCSLTNQFFDGTKCKICFGNHRFNFKPKKKGVNFFPQSRTQRGGWGVPRLGVKGREKTLIFPIARKWV